GLARVGRAEVGHDRFGRQTPLRQLDLDRALGARHVSVDARAAGALVAFRAARALRPAASLSSSAGHRLRVPPSLRQRVAHASPARRPYPRGAYTLRKRRRVIPEPRAPTASPMRISVRAMKENERACTSGEVYVLGMIAGITTSF